MTGPTVSVALATYQGARFVEAQVRSILEQSRPVDEIVVGDDGSTDGTVDLIRALVGATADGPRLVVLPPAERSGVAANFSRVLGATTGDLVVLSDQDDVWHPDRVEAAVARFAAEPELDVLFGDARLVDADGGDLGATLFGALPVRESELLAIERGRPLDVLLRRNVATGATMAVRRRAVDRALPVGAGWIHDEWLAATAAVAGRIGVERRPLVDYRQHGGNEIGVVAPTLRYRIRRMLEPRGERNVRLATAFAALADWGRSHGSAHDLLRAKAEFEARRAGAPRVRPARLPVILGQFAGYRRFASQGMLDAARDLLQRA